MPRTDDGLGFLIVDVSRLMRRRFAEELKATSVRLTLAQARALVYISRRQGLRQVELAAVMEIQPITLARVVDQLAGAGFIERRADAGGRRAYQLYLRPAARPQLALIAQATELYGDEDIGVELRKAAYALDSTAIDLCLLLFPWAKFRRTKAAIKVHTLLALRGNPNRNAQ